MKLLALALAFWSLSAHLSCWAEQEHQRFCFSAQETREKIFTHKLAEPFRVMRFAAAQAQAEPIGAKLCRWREEFVYEISLLRRDGHVLHIFINATDGHTIAVRNAPDRFGTAPERFSGPERFGGEH